MKKSRSPGNKADSIVSAVVEVYNLARYLPEMRDAIETGWGAVLARLDPRRVGGSFAALARTNSVHARSGR
jgi:hypothetical protein